MDGQLPVYILFLTEIKPTRSDSERREFYKKYGYIKYLVGKIGKRLVCNKCRDDIYELISENIRDTIIDMDID